MQSVGARVSSGNSVNFHSFHRFPIDSPLMLTDAERIVFTMPTHISLTYIYRKDIIDEKSILLKSMSFFCIRMEKIKISKSICSIL